MILNLNRKVKFKLQKAR